MTIDTLHADEFAINDTLVQQLIALQCPQWSTLTLNRLSTSGTDNVIYRLGEQMLIRLPRTPEAVERTIKEQQWLTKLAPLLPLPISAPLATGISSVIYPAVWSVFPWLSGETADQATVLDEVSIAIQLADFIAAMHGLDAQDGPPPGTHNFYRGVALAERDEETRAAIAELANDMDTHAAIVVWDRALQADPWQGSPVWIHGDLLPTNILIEQGKISAIIDFGGLGVGDPACDLIPAWSLFSGQAREVFRQRLGVDEDTWLRGQGWALSIGLIALPYYRVTNTTLASIATKMIAQVLSSQ